ncbi:MAG: hypothetical protein ABEK59_03335 [Halobacteria archaeon]
MKWKVRLTGSDRGLETLAESFTDEPEVFEDDDKFFLWSSQFEDLNNAKEVRDKAEEIVKIIRNFGIKDSLRTDELQASHIHEIYEDDSEHVTVRAEVATIKMKAGPVHVTTTDEDGDEEVHRPADRTYELTQLATEDDKVRDLVDLLDKGNNWVNLYRIYEFIQENIDGDKNIVDRDWWNSNEKDLFKQTANSRDAIGDDARHGQDRIPAPEDPMNYSEAKNLVNSLIQDWLEHRKEL